MAGAGILGVVGTVLPWATFGPLEKMGTEGDGAITLVMAIVVAASGIWIAQRAPLGLDVGSGLWVTLFAGGVGAVAGIWALAIRPGAKAAASR